MSSFTRQIETFFWNIFNRPQLHDIFDILIVAVLIYYLIMLTRETRANEVMKGLVLLLVACAVFNAMGLTALSWVLTLILSNGSRIVEPICESPFINAIGVQTKKSRGWVWIV